MATYCKNFEKWVKFKANHEGEVRDFVEPAPECVECPKFKGCCGLVVAAANMEMVNAFLERARWGVTDN